jgi:hypothetical protein
MQTIGHRALGILGIGAVLLLPGLAVAQSVDMETLVPGEMLTDEEIDPYYGKGIEGVDFDITGDSNAVDFDFSGTQNNVDDFQSEVMATSGSEQGFVLVTQYSGDDGQIVNNILINVLINSVQNGAPVQSIMEDQAQITTGVNGTGATTIDITATTGAFSAGVNLNDEQL